jgi:hypothetical protein
MNAFIKSYDKSQKKAAGKGKRKCSDSDNDFSDSDSNYSNSYQIVALKPKRSKIGIPTTEVIGETNLRDNKIPLRILIDTGSISSIIVKLLPLPQPPLRARTDARTKPSAQRATQLRSVLARMHAVSRQNQITTAVT